MTVLTADSMKKLEQAAVKGGLSYLRLMENAGSAAARVIRSAWPLAGRRVAVLCGDGNNGGDGFVIARRLLDEGARITVVTVGTPSTPQAKEMFSRLTGTDVTICRLETEPLLAGEAVQSAGLIVDALFGIGFHCPLPDHLRHLLRMVNASAAPVVAVDIPSGVEADSGTADPDTVRADCTVTFTALKPALVAATVLPYCGRVEVVTIGIDDELVDRFSGGEVAVGWGMVQAHFPARDPWAHKGDFGHLLTVTGSDGMVGAARLCAEAALRCGVGLLTAALPREAYPAFTAALPEAVCLPLENTGLSAQLVLRECAAKADAVVLGCGIGRRAESLVWDVLSHGDTPLVLDADGINTVCLHIDKLKTIRRPLVLTPHPGEMARLTGRTVEDVEAHRAAVARAFAEEYDVTLVLKGHETLIAAPHRALLVNHTGNPGMATGGSGDVLAGMIGAFLAQGMEPYAAAMCAVHLHGLAGDRAAAALSQHAMLPRDLIAQLGGLFLDLEKRVSPHETSPVVSVPSAAPAPADRV